VQGDSAKRKGLLGGIEFYDRESNDVVEMLGRQQHSGHLSGIPRQLLWTHSEENVRDFT
jgi:hypothetical protein